MSNISSHFGNGGTMLAVGLPHLSGASPTTFYCGNLLWQQMVQGKSSSKFSTPEDVNKAIQLEVQGLRGYSPLHQFACSGQLKSATSFLENCSPSDANKQDSNGNTPLIWAAYEGNDDIVQLLVDNRVDLNLQNFNGETALFVAASRGFENMCQILLENGANPNIPNVDGATPSHMASANGHMDTLMLLLNHGAFVNSQDECGDSLLHYAVRENQLRTVEMLVTRFNACVDLKNDDRETAMELASCLEYTDIVFFLSKFASQSTQNEDEDDEMEEEAIMEEDKYGGNYKHCFLGRGLVY